MAEPFHLWFRDIAGEPSASGDLAQDVCDDECMPPEATIEEMITHIRTHVYGDVLLVSAFADAVYDYVVWRFDAEPGYVYSFTYKRR